MALTGFHCEADDSSVSFEECLDCAKRRLPRPNGMHCQYPYSYIKACIPGSERKNAGISATMLAGECPRKTWWEKTLPYELYPSQLQASVKGTAQHNYFEQFNEEGILAEVRLAIKMPSGRLITGQIDRYLIEHNRIEDYKFKKEDKAPFDTAPANYVMQLNIYRYMLTKGCVILETGEIIPPQEIKELVLFPSNHKDWFEVYCPLWPLEMVEKYIETLLDVFQAAENDTPPRGYEDPHTNRFCREWCPFNKHCIATGGEHREIYVEVLVGAA